MAATPPYRTAWSRKPPARVGREVVYLGILGPLVDLLASPRVTGLENLRHLKPPVVFAANHSSHVDTPVILRALPAKWRHRTVVVAAADYFYRDSMRRFLVSLAFGTIPVERDHLSSHSARRMDQLLETGWSILIYPEGTRSRTGTLGDLHHGASYLAVQHGLPLVPIGLRGTHEVLPPGGSKPRRHPVEMHVGAPLLPSFDDHHEVTERLRDSLIQLGARD